MNLKFSLNSIKSLKSYGWNGLQLYGSAQLFILQNVYKVTVLEYILLEKFLISSLHILSDITVCKLFTYVFLNWI